MKVQITGYISNQFHPISFVKLLRGVTGEGLATAKEYLDRLTEGEILEIDLPTRESAEAFVRAASNIGAKAIISTL